MAEHDRERGKCPDCDGPIAECSDPTRDLWAYRRICYVTMEQRAAEEDYKSLHEKAPYHNHDFSDWSATRDKGHPVHFEWGVKIGVAPFDVNPHDEFRTVEKQSPLPPDGDQ